MSKTRKEDILVPPSGMVPSGQMKAPRPHHVEVPPAAMVLSQKADDEVVTDGVLIRPYDQLMELSQAKPLKDGSIEDDAQC